MISVVMMIAGLVGLNYFSKHKDLPKFVPAPIKKEMPDKKNKK